MRRTLLLLACCVAAVDGFAAPQAFGPYESMPSPSGQFVASAAIARAEVSPSARMRLRVVVTDVVSLRVDQVVTWLTSPWSIAWSSDRTFLACGRLEEADKPEPFVVLAYDIDKEGRLIERLATDREKAQARAAFDAKHK